MAAPCFGSGGGQVGRMRSVDAWLGAKQRLARHLGEPSWELAIDNALVRLPASVDTRSNYKSL